MLAYWPSKQNKDEGSAAWSVGAAWATIALLNLHNNVPGDCSHHSLEWSSAYVTTKLESSGFKTQIS